MGVLGLRRGEGRNGETGEERNREEGGVINVEGSLGEKRESEERSDVEKKGGVSQ